MQVWWNGDKREDNDDYEGSDGKNDEIGDAVVMVMEMVILLTLMTMLRKILIKNITTLTE